jgi:prefoldin subunit 5
MSLVEYDNVQKKTFTKWVNTHLINAGMRVNDLYEDFRDGIRLITLLELLTKEKLKREKGKMRVHRRLNCQTALDCLDRHKVKLVGITSDSIVDGNKKLILGLVWTLILHFQLSSGGEGSTAEVKKELLAWAQTAVEPYDLSVKNFSHDWSDGKVFCAVLHRHRPDIIDYSKVEDSPPQANLELAFDTAYDKLGVEKLLDPEDVAVSNPDEKSILTYVSFLRQQFPTMPPAPKRGPAVSPDDYKSLHDDLTKWAEDKLEEVKDRDFPKSLPEMMSLKKDFQKYLTGELPTKTHEKMQLAEMAASLEASKKASPDLFEQYPMDKLNKTWVELGAETAARKKAIDEEIKRLEDLEALAKQTKETCDESDKKMDKIEDKIKQLSEEMEKLTPESCSKMLNKIRKDLEGVSVPVKEVRGNCDKLEDGRYWDMDAVKPKVNNTEEKYEELKKRLAELEEAAAETGGVKEKVADLHKRFQEVTGWKAGKEFAATKDEKKDFLDKANEEFAELLADPKLAPHVPDTLAAQHDIANKHWEELCKLQESEKEAEKVQ